MLQEVELWYFVSSFISFSLFSFSLGFKVECPEALLIRSEDFYAVLSIIWFSDLIVWSSSSSAFSIIMATSKYRWPL